jgi:hypothetical protein
MVARHAAADKRQTAAASEGGEAAARAQVRYEIEPKQMAKFRQIAAAAASGSLSHGI